jgi:lipopolysaccharide biosynthesis protein
LGDLFLVAIQSGGAIDPRKLGFDTALEFPPHGVPILPQINRYLKITNPDFSGMVYDYRQIAKQMGNQNPPGYPLFKTVITGWDNTPRRQDQPLIFHNSTPQQYLSWLTAAIKYTVENSPTQERFVFINAWNEWAESTYLEPDRKFGYAYLDATARAIDSMLDKKVITDPVPVSNHVKNTAILR